MSQPVSESAFDKNERPREDQPTQCKPRDPLPCPALVYLSRHQTHTQHHYYLQLNLFLCGCIRKEVVAVSECLCYTTHLLLAAFISCNSRRN